MSSVIYIKGMVCLRCKMAVQAVLEDAGADVKRIELGWAELKMPLTNTQMEIVTNGLSSFELYILQDKASILTEKIKNEITGILNLAEPLLLKLSVHLSKETGNNYTYLANTFSEKEGITLERYYISQRIERVKELIIYEEMSLNDIMYKLAFSSVSHLCQQFKKVTNYTPAEFRKMSKQKDFIWKKLADQ